MLAKPTIDKPSSNTYQIVKEGKNLTLMCIASGQPKPEIKWYRQSLHPYVKNEARKGERYMYMYEYMNWCLEKVLYPCWSGRYHSLKKNYHSAFASSEIHSVHLKTHMFIFEYNFL